MEQDTQLHSPDGLDFASLQGLRHFQKSFILQEPSEDSLFELFPLVLESASRADKPLEWQLAALDALSIWILRATRSSNPSQLGSKITSHDWESLISLVWIRWSSAPNSNAIQKILKEVFSKTLVFQRVVFADWKEREVELLKRIVLMTGVDIKVQCFLIEMLVRRALNGSKLVLELKSSWVDEMLGHMKDGGAGPAVGKCLVTVLMVRRAELTDQDPENGHTLWLEIWKNPLLGVISTSDEAHIRLLNKYFLPTLSKECPYAFRDLLQSMANDILNKRQTTGLQAFMLCLNIAKRNNLLPNDVTVAFTDMGLPSTFFHSLLTNVSYTIRVAAFDLLTFHTHQKTPLSLTAFTLVQSVLPYFFADQNAEFRIEVLRVIRGLIQRLQASTRSLCKELERRTSKLGNATAELADLLQIATNFAHWLVRYCRESLTPGRSYYTASMSLKTLHSMCEQGFFSDIEVEGKSEVLSGVRLILFSPSMLRLLLDRLADAYDEVAKLACQLIERMKHPEMIPWDELCNKGLELSLSGRADNSEGGAKVLFLCKQFDKVNGYTNIWEDIWESVLRDLKCGSLRDVAVEKPVHGRLVALSGNADVVNRILRLCESIWEIVSPILTHDSPEGNLHNLISEVETPSLSPLRDASAQDFLSGSWRALKEASALLGSVLSAQESTVEDYQVAGTLFMEWLSHIRHRGAFSAVMPSFEQLCTECFKDKTKTLNTLPPQWLNECLLSMTATTRSITRRSGGLPMLITAILIAEADVQSYELTKLAVTHLLAIANSAIDASGYGDLAPAKWDLPQVHAQNSLRAIFTEGRLAQTSVGFVEEAFAVAVKGFSSEIFPIRNSSIMLFDSLLSRALGQRYARQDIDPSAPNRSVSSKVFFSKFPKLNKYLLDQLTCDVSLLESNEDIVNTGLYPILTLISRLDVTRSADSRKYTGMQPFLPLIQKCMGSKIWKVRAMAARCLPVVVDPIIISSEINNMFSGFRLSSQNELHGGLMGIKRLGEFYSYRELRDVVLDAITTGMMEKLGLGLRQNPNPLTKAAFLDVAQLLFRKSEHARCFVDSAVHTWLDDLRGGENHPMGWQLYLEQGTSLFLDGIRDWNDGLQSTPIDVLELLLKNENEEVVLKALSWLDESKNDILSNLSIRQALRSLIDQQRWDSVRALALRAMSGTVVAKEEGIPLRECLTAFQKDNVMPLREAWIVMSGSAAKKECLRDTIDEGVLAEYFETLFTCIQPQQPETIRLAALQSLQAFSPILTAAFENSSSTPSIVSAAFVLLLLLSDDDHHIRHVASEIVSAVLGDFMVSTPMAASNKFAQAIGETFNPQGIVMNLIPLICMTNVREELKTALGTSNTLFAKERQNLWRDEVYQCELYTRILSICWSRRMCTESSSDDDALLDWVEKSISEIREVIEFNDDVPLGWTRDMDAFESATKVFIIVEALQRFGYNKRDMMLTKGLENTMSRLKGYEIWKEKMEEICGSTLRAPRAVSASETPDLKFLKLDG